MSNKEDKVYVYNGIIDSVPTGDENDSTIGIVRETKTESFGGKIITSRTPLVALSKYFEAELGWGKRKASVRYYIGDTEVNPKTVDEDRIRHILGDLEVDYHHRYSDYTGYLWTESGFKIGGHDMLKTLRENKGKYIHLEITIHI